MIHNYLISLSIFLLTTQLHFSQQKDPDELLSKVKSEFQKVQDYSVDVKINVDVEFIKVPKSNAVIYFKQPDKISLKSDGFAMLPRKGFDFSPTSLLRNDYTAIYEKEEMLNGIKTSVVKVIPLGSTEDVILSTLWIDEERNFIRKIESTTKSSGTFTIELDYDDKFNYALPSKMVFNFNIDKMNLPSTMMGETEKRKDKDERNRDTLTRGKVIVEYSNYKVNEGIPDSNFDE